MIARFFFVTAIGSNPTPFMDGRVAAHAVSAAETGATVHLSLTILDEPDRTMPLLVWLSAGEGLELMENRWTWFHVVDPGAVQPRMQGRARLVASGHHRVEALVMYGTCAGARCRPRFARTHWTVDVVEGPVARDPTGA